MGGALDSGSSSLRWRSRCAIAWSSGCSPTEERARAEDPKRVHYLSIEFLIGRLAGRQPRQPGAPRTSTASALRGLGADLDEIEESEVDAALGNGGLGRLAACFLDSLATLGMPGYGYGILYEYGLFKQEIDDGASGRSRTTGSRRARPGRSPARSEACLVPIYGRIEHGVDRAGGYNPMWMDWSGLVGVPHDILIPGYGGAHRQLPAPLLGAIVARLRHADLQRGRLRQGRRAEDRLRDDLEGALSRRTPSPPAASSGWCRSTSSSPAPSATSSGRTTEATRTCGGSRRRSPSSSTTRTPRSRSRSSCASWSTSATSAWDEACTITRAMFGFTNHTLAPEALERWSVPLLEHVIPRHLQIILEINRRLLDRAASLHPGDGARLRRVSLVEEAESQGGPDDPPRDGREPLGERRLGHPLRARTDVALARFLRPLARSGSTT